MRAGRYVEALLPRCSHRLTCLRGGLQTYLERLLMRAVHGEGARGLSFTIGRKAMKDSLREFQEQGKDRYMRLVVPYGAGEDPECVSRSHAVQKAKAPS
jgi:hypothetical protein